MQSIIAWFLRLKGISSSTAGIIASLVAWLLDFLREKEADGTIDPHLKRTPEEEKREAERGQLPADENHDFPHMMN